MSASRRPERPLVAWLEAFVPEELRRDPLTRRRALLAVGFVAALLVAALPLIPFLLVTSEPSVRALAVGNTLLCVGALCLGLVPLRRWHSLWLTGNWFCVCLYLGLAYAIVQGHGARAPFAVSLALLPAFAGIIAGRRAGVAWGALAATTVALVAALPALGVELPDGNPRGYALELLAAGALVATLVLLTWMTSFSETTKEEAIDRVRDASERLAVAVREERRARVAADEAIAASAAKSAFLATMSHELRTPLNAILGYSEMVLDVLEERGQSELAADLRRVHGAGRHLLGLITDVLDLTRIEADRLELDPTEFDPAALLRELAEIFRPLAQRSGDTLALDLPDQLGLAFHDLTRVRQILINLLGNAIKFTSGGAIVLRARGDADTLELDVADTGIGIPAHMLSEIFEPFTQVDSSSTRRYEGSGLGLAVCRKLASLMGGTIDATSTPGRGSTFTVRLPRRFVRHAQGPGDSLRALALGREQTDRGRPTAPGS